MWRLISTNDRVGNESRMFLPWKKVQPLLRMEKLHSLRRVIIHKETWWIAQQHGNDLLGPEVLNGSTKLGQEREIRTVSVNSVLHDVLAVYLYEDTAYGQRRRKYRTRGALYLSDEQAQDFDFGEP
jgi:hypothetical protein